MNSVWEIFLSHGSFYRDNVVATVFVLCPLAKKEEEDDVQWSSDGGSEPNDIWGVGGATTMAAPGRGRRWKQHHHLWLMDTCRRCLSWGRRWRLWPEAEEMALEVGDGSMAIGEDEVRTKWGFHYWEVAKIIEKLSRGVYVDFVSHTLTYRYLSSTKNLNLRKSSDEMAHLKM